MEDDNLVLGRERPLIAGSEDHTVLIKNSIRFSYFGERFHRNNMPEHLCMYNSSDPDTWLCNIFKLGKKYYWMYGKLMLHLSERKKRFLWLTIRTF